MLVDFNIQGVTAFATKLPLSLEVAEAFSHWMPESLEKAALVRREEFLAGRFCAHEAASEMGVILNSLPVGTTREPMWPANLRGSISHSKKMAISCVTKAEDDFWVGIDAEEIIPQELSENIQNTIAHPEELELIAGFGRKDALTILFSAKESLYKALFPVVRTFIDYKEVKFRALNSDNNTFEIELISMNPVLEKYRGVYQGQFKYVDETIVTLISIPKLGKQEAHVYS